MCYTYGSLAQTALYPKNASACEECHGMPSKFGTSPLTVERIGLMVDGRFIAGLEGGIRHREGTSENLIETRGGNFRNQNIY
jgi:hypothetical protein